MYTIDFLYAHNTIYTNNVSMYLTWILYLIYNEFDIQHVVNSYNNASKLHLNQTG